MTPDTDYHRWAFEAKHNGIPMYQFRRRLRDYHFDAERAATQPLQAKPKRPDSVQALLRETGVASVSYYRAKRYLDEMGVDYTKQDIIDICKARRRG